MACSARHRRRAAGSPRVSELRWQPARPGQQGPREAWWKEPRISPVEYYITILLVYIGTDLIAAWGLSLEFGVTGLPNLAYIIFLACGAYTYSVLTVGPAARYGPSETWIIGGHLAPILAILIAVAAAAVLGLLVGLTGLRRLRLDYQAIAFLIISFVAISIVNADNSLLNGSNGMSLVPTPIAGFSESAQPWVYVGIVGVICILTVLLVRQMSNGPLGRTLRAVRDDEEAALAAGKNVVWLRLLVQIVGAALAGLSGALLVGFIGGWSPAAWGYDETLAFMTCVIIGGRGNNRGTFVGTVLVLGAFLQGVQYLPSLPGRPALADDLGWVIVGGLTIAFLFLRPQGIFPERRPRYLTGPGHEPAPAAGAAALAVDPRPLSGHSDDPAVAHAVDRGAAPLVATMAREPPAGKATSGAAALSVRDLVKSFGGARAVDGATFQVPARSIVGLIGPNGAGKTTVVGMVSGSLRADAGIVELAGRNITRDPPYQRARRGLARTFQLSREFGRLTTIENLLTAPVRQRGERLAVALAGKRYWGAEEERHLERARELLELFEMSHQADALAANLSGGQKRLVEVMRTLMLEPRVILLDEPMAGLSPAIAERLEEACLALRESGMSILLVEHELGPVERLCDNVVVMAQGKVLAEGPMAELRRSAEVQDAYLVG